MSRRIDSQGARKMCRIAIELHADFVKGTLAMAAYLPEKNFG
jgi:hypothetical protein